MVFTSRRCAIVGAVGTAVALASCPASFATPAAAASSGAPPVGKAPDLESKELYKHSWKDGKEGGAIAKGSELHCPDRKLIHPCTSELQKFLKERNADYKQAALECSKTVYNTMQHDYWVMKNMTHLLLDLDTSVHNFDKENRDNDFYQLGLDFGHKLQHHPECLAEFDDKDPLECRCPLLYGKILLLKYKNAGRIEDARKFYNQMKEFEWKGNKTHFPAGEAFPWKNFYQTPQVFFPELETQEVWPEEKRASLPVWDVLENNYEDIKEETLKAFNNDTHVEDAYRFLFTGGRWDQILLFHGRNFTEACEVMPKTCKVLKESLPARDVHHYPWVSNQNEQVVILKTTPGTDVEVHSGPGNNILNVHMGLVVPDGAELFVGDVKTTWREGKVIPWDGSYDHSINCKKCKSDRIVIMVRYMHPDVKKEHYKGNAKTHFEPVLEKWTKEPGWFDVPWRVAGAGEPVRSEL